jgi:hypothetical protein
MKLDIHAFSAGVAQGLQKAAQLGGGFESVLAGHQGSEAILPHQETQRKWSYARTPEGLRLHDGTRSWGFGISEFGGEVGRVPRLPDLGPMEWDKDATSRGTAQIHRSSPDSIYLTLHDGRQNPTFYLEHMEGRDWKYIPGKKLRKMLEGGGSTVSVDPGALMDGAQLGAKSAGLREMLVGNGASSLLDPTRRGLLTDMALYSNPFTGVAAGTYDTANNLLHGRLLSALGSAGMGALSLTGVGGVAGALGKGALRGVRLLRGAGATGRALSRPALGALKGARSVGTSGASGVRTLEGNIVGGVRKVIPEKYTSFEHGLQNPLATVDGKLSIRSPFSKDYSTRKLLRSGVDRVVANPLRAATFLHPMGVSGLVEEDPQAIERMG